MIEQADIETLSLLALVAFIAVSMAKFPTYKSSDKSLWVLLALLSVINTTLYVVRGCIWPSIIWAVLSLAWATLLVVWLKQYAKLLED